MDMKKGILIAVLFLAVGFAAVTTTLTITGTINIKPDSTDFEEKVIFKTAAVDSASQTAGSTAVVSGDGKTITVTTHELRDIGDNVVVSYTIENGSSYDASIGALTCSATNPTDATNYATYLDITPANGLATATATTPLQAGATSATDTLTIRLKSSYAGKPATGNVDDEDYDDGNSPISIGITCTMKASAVERTTAGS